jgi:hypothetical protein
VTSNKLTNHLKVDCYSGFRLTEAIRPSLDLEVIPRQGYRRETYRDGTQKLEVPVLAAAVSAERLFDVFLELLGPLGEVVDVVLESSHNQEDGGHQDLLREHIDTTVLLSHLLDFEDLLLNDGCTGLAIISTTRPMEVQFDEHKLLLVYAKDLTPFEGVFRSAGVRRDDSLRLITEGEHMHSTDDRFLTPFEQLSYRLGVGEEAETVNDWETGECGY